MKATLARTTDAARGYVLTHRIPAPEHTRTRPGSAFALRRHEAPIRGFTASWLVVSPLYIRLGKTKAVVYRH